MQYTSSEIFKHDAWIINNICNDTNIGDTRNKIVKQIWFEILGKTTLADTLVASNGIISQRMAGKVRNAVNCTKKGNYDGYTIIFYCASEFELKIHSILVTLICVCLCNLYFTAGLCFTSP